MIYIVSFILLVYCVISYHQGYDKGFKDGQKMSNTFKKWQNREISDIECIRELHSLVIGLHKKNTEFEKENEDLKKKLESKYNVL